MLRPSFQRKLRLALLMLASALIFLAEPVFARRENRESSSRESAQHSGFCSHRTCSSSRTPPAMSTRNSQLSASRHAVQPQSRSEVSDSIIIFRSQSSTQNRAITSSPSISEPSRNVITNKPSQPQTKFNNSISTNRSVSSRTMTNPPSISSRSTISSGLTNSLGAAIGSDTLSSNPINSSRSNIITNRQTTRNTINESISRNNDIFNGSREIANSSNRASQPVASPNNRISSELSSHIGDTIGTQPNPRPTSESRKITVRGIRFIYHLTDNPIH